jgi:hypothetical protein
MFITDSTPEAPRMTLPTPASRSGAPISARPGRKPPRCQSSGIAGHRGAGAVEHGSQVDALQREADPAADDRDGHDREVEQHDDAADADALLEPEVVEVGQQRERGNRAATGGDRAGASTSPSRPASSTTTARCARPAA